VDVDRAFFHVDIAAPDAVEQLLACVHALGMRHEEREHPVFGGAQRHGSLARAHALTALVQDQALDVDAFGALDRRGPAQDGIDSSQQLARRERLGDVVVGAAFQTRHLVALFGARGKHDDRQFAGLAVTFERPREFEAAGVRKHPVDEQQVRELVGDFGAARSGIGRFPYFEPGATKPEGDHFANGAFVFDYQNLFG
jgi:hypothetical protein